MADEKKATAKVIVPVKAEAKTEVKKEEAPKAAAKKAPAKKAPAKKATATKAAAPAAKATATKAVAAKKVEKKEEAPKAAAKKAPAKKAAAPAKKAPAAKTAVKSTVNFEFAGKSYTPDALVSIAKDVWKYDLNGKDADFKSVELYIKPEESTAYYVINGDVTGSFFI